MKEELTGQSEPIDFSRKIKKRICKNCGKERGSHKAVTLHCPSGPKYRIGYVDFSSTQTFEEK